MTDLFRGGQGRDASDVEDVGLVTAIIFTIAVVVLACVCIGIWLTRDNMAGGASTGYPPSNSEHARPPGDVRSAGGRSPPAGRPNNVVVDSPSEEG